MSLELAHRLLMTQTVSRRDVEAALLRHAKSRVSFVSALLELRPKLLPVLEQELEREGPITADLAPDPGLMRWLPEGLCLTLFGFPIGITASTNLVDVLVAQPSEQQIAEEFSYHLKADVRLLRGRLTHIAEALESLEGHLVPHTVRHPSWLHGSGQGPLKPTPLVRVQSAPTNGPSTQRGVAPPALGTLEARRARANHRDTLRPPSFHPESGAQQSTEHGHLTPVTPHQVRLKAPRAPSQVDAASSEDALQEHAEGASPPLELTEQDIISGREATDERPSAQDPPLSLPEQQSQSATAEKSQSATAEKSQSATAEKSQSATDEQLVAAALAALRGAGHPDEIVEHLLSGIRGICEEAVVLSVRNRELKSRARCLFGGDVRRDLSRSLLVERSGGLHKALTQEQYLGTAGSAEHGLMERTFSQVCITCVSVAGRPALMLIAGGFESGFELSHRSDTLARAASEALSRVLMARKTQSR